MGVCVVFVNKGRPVWHVSFVDVKLLTLVKICWCTLFKDNSALEYKCICCYIFNC